MIFRRRKPRAQRLADAILRMIERDSRQATPPFDFVVTSCRVQPYVSYGPDEPDGVEISVEIRGASR